ncbi:hypothetical protein FK268_09280 [Tsukamurella sputi]|uniref:Uncharacterized protein n=1 Tax=Tsukamurella sputi TaxID=2591848 RepID=A0A5C5RS01_9ACTN|nr:hypothetical protein [Tsukamurella sputi]TWS25372.1 hypothetical protein FK268_09280 [Tsukamurella sputi]
MSQITWFKIDDGFWSHPKVAMLSDGAVALWARAGSYSCQHLTDGVVARTLLRMLGTVDAADELVAAGLWDATPDGWVFHDWSEYQETSAVVKRRRDESRERQRRSRARREEKRSDTQGPSRGESQSVSRVTDDVTDGVSSLPPTRPDPTRPDPTSEVVTGGGGVTSGNARETPPPGNLDPSNPRCPKHVGVSASDAGPNCVGCKRVREWCESAPERAAADDLSARRSRREAIDGCGLCDDQGYVLGVEPVRRCAHLRPAQES